MKTQENTATLKIYRVGADVDEWYPYWIAATDEEGAFKVYEDITGLTQSDGIVCSVCDEGETMCDCAEYDSSCTILEEGGICVNHKPLMQVALRRMLAGEVLPFDVASISD